MHRKYSMVIKNVLDKAISWISLKRTILPSDNKMMKHKIPLELFLWWNLFYLTDQMLDTLNKPVKKKNEKINWNFLNL